MMIFDDGALGIRRDGGESQYFVDTATVQIRVPRPQVDALHRPLFNRFARATGADKCHGEKVVGARSLVVPRAPDYQSCKQQR